MSYLDSLRYRSVPMELACMIGPWEASFLVHIHELLDYRRKQNDAHAHEGQEWTYCTYERWREDYPFLSVRTVRRTFKSLEDLGLIVTGEFNKVKSDRTKWYAIDYTAVDTLCGQIGHLQSSPTGPPHASNVAASNHDQPTLPSQDKTPAATASEVAEEFIQAIDPEEEVILLAERPLHGPTCSRFWRVMLRAGGLTKGTLPEHNKAEQGQLRKLMAKLGPSGPTQLSYALLNYGAFTIYAQENHDFKLPAKPNIIKMTALADAILEFEPPLELPESEYQLKTVAEMMDGKA